MRQFIIYSKPGCHLCERAYHVLERCQQWESFSLAVIDISQDPELDARYRHDIPVILLDGLEVARHFLREQQVLELLRNPTAGDHP